MKPTLYHKILKLATSGKINTITVDVFDTILLNDYWPNDLRYLDLANSWLPIIHRVISSQITAYELYDWRRFAQNELQHTHQPLRLDLWLDALINLLCHKYHIALTDDQHLELLASLITIELDFIIHNTQINHSLITQLSAVKQLIPKLKIYFITHSPLTSAQIKTLFTISHIQVFDGGISSSDLTNDYSSDELYHVLLSNLSSKINPQTNLHIGDQHSRDCLTPRARGSYTLPYRPLRLRGLRTLIGVNALRVRQTLAILRARRTDKSISAMQQHAIMNQLWSSQLTLATELNPQAHFLLTQGIAATQTSTDNIIHAPELDQTTIFRAFVWLLATYNSPRWNAAQVLKLLYQTLQLPHRRSLYQLCFDSDYAISQLAIDAYDDQTFWSAFLAELTAAPAEQIETLRQSYIIAVQYLPRDNQPLIYVTSTNDHAAMLFREFARLHQITTEITEWQLNPANHPPLTNLETNEPTNENLPPHTELAPDQYYAKVIATKLPKNH